MTAVQRAQDAAYSFDYDYTVGSPHLRHPHLHALVRSTLRVALDDVRDRGLPAVWLDIGSGHGSFVEPLLAWGASVTATEMSVASHDRIKAAYGHNPMLETALVGQDGTVGAEGQFSALSFISVLHHIPDYVSEMERYCERFLVEGGSLVAMQDPLWYPRRNTWSGFLHELSYVAWRATRPGLLDGIRNRFRRRRDGFDRDITADMVEYHVVRDGVDEVAVTEWLEAHFEIVHLIPYWSTQSPLWQRVGDQLGVANTFGVTAFGYRGS